MELWKLRSAAAIAVLLAGLPSAVAGQSPDLAEFLEQQRVAGGLPGLAAVVVDTEGLSWEIGLGWAEVGIRPVRPDTPFLVASVSKPVTATAVVAAAEDGLLSLDEDLRAAFSFPFVHPFFPESPLTPRQLLAHASSVLDDPVRLAAALGPGDPTVSLEAFLADYFRPGELRSWSSRAPATAFSYSNVGIALAGRLLEERSGESFAAFLDDRLFVPLGMTDSSWTLAGLSQPAAVPYRSTAAGWAPYEPYGAPYAPAVLLRTSARDLGRFLAFWLARGRVGEQQVISSAAVAEMEHIQFPLSGLQGLGWRYLNAGGHLVLGHGGSGSGVTSEMVVDRARGRAVAVLTNVDATQGAASRAFQAVLDRLLAESDFPDEEPPVAEPRSWQLPAVVRGPRGGVDEYRSDLWLFNPHDQSVDLLLAFQPRGLAVAPAPVPLTLAPGEGREVTDVLSVLFGLSAAQGALTLTVAPVNGAVPEISALARVGVEGGPAQWIAAEDLAEAAGERWIVGVHQGPDPGGGFEATLAVLNAEATARSITLDAWNAQGQAVGTADIALPPHGYRSARIDRLLPELSRGGGPFSLRLRGAGHFLAAATLLEAGSGDALWLPAQIPGSELGAVLVPRVVRGRGQRGATWATELALHNPTDAPLPIRVEWRSRGAASGASEVVLLTLAPRETRVEPDCLASLFGSTADLAGSLTVSALGEGGAPVVSALGLVRTAGGLRLGTGIPALQGRSTRAQSAFGAGWGAGRDTSVGVIHGGDQALAVELTLIDDAGRALGQRRLDLAPHQHLERTLLGLFPGLAAGRGWTVTARTEADTPWTLYLASLDEVGDADLLLAVPSPDRPARAAPVK